MHLSLNAGLVRDMWNAGGRPGLYAVRTDDGITLEVRQRPSAWDGTRYRGTDYGIAEGHYLLLTPDRLATIIAGYNRTTVKAELPDNLAIHALVWEMSNTNFHIWAESWATWQAYDADVRKRIGR